MRLPPLRLRQEWPYFLVLALVLAIGVNNVVEGLADWHLYDMRVYHDAALRLRVGEPLYGGDVTPYNAYRYAPWFAYVWVPMTFLSAEAERALWSMALLGGTAVCLLPLLRASKSHLLAAALFGTLLFGISTGGNVQALMVAGLMFGLPSRFGWLAVGLAASMKVVPLAFVAVFIAQGRWRQAAGAMVLTVALWAPILAFHVDPVTFEAGAAGILPQPVWLAVGSLTALFTLGLAKRRSRWTAQAASVAAILALPRLFAYEVTLLLVAVNQNATPRQPDDAASNSHLDHQHRKSPG